MKKAFGAALVLGSIWLAAGVCLAQGDIRELADPAFGKRERPAASFAHEAHNAKAGIKDCNVCHHVYQNSRFVSDESSAGQKCSECHRPGGSAVRVPLMRAYHLQCKECHRYEGKGPLACGGCHRRG